MAGQLTLLGLQFKDTQSFDSYYAGHNEEAVSYLKDFIKGNEELFVYLWGKPHGGLSHLLQASCQYAKDLNINAIYLPLKELLSYSPEGLSGLEELAFVCLDDVDAVMGNPAWEEKLFHLFNALRDRKHRLLISAHVPPRELSLSLADLKSRLTWGTVFHVDALSDDEMLVALQEKAATRGMHVSEEVAQFLLRRCSRDPAKLFSLLETLDAASLKEHRRLTVPFVKEILEL